VKEKMTETVTIKLGKSMKEQLRALAEADRRTLSSYIANRVAGLPDGTGRQAEAGVEIAVACAMAWHPGRDVHVLVANRPHITAVGSRSLYCNSAPQCVIDDMSRVRCWR
jgi:hypothetical protein